MLEWLWLVPLFPLLGFVILAMLSPPKPIAAWVGVGSIGLAALITLLIALEFLALPIDNRAFALDLWQWFSVAGLDIGFSFYLDGLALVMMAIITGVGFLIHLYSVGYMAEDAAFARFFAYMNLFVAMMLTLVLGDNLVVLFLGWEGVGLCSYLLIGFWYDNPENGYAARKAFVVTRIGDVSMALGLFVLFAQLGSLDIQTLMQQAELNWAVGDQWALWAALLLLGGALGKSAQLPLQTWLPDAMAGPTPISALIHAATMVTAGVYLIARTHELFMLAPDVLQLVAWIGAITLLISGFTALVQTDIKKILAFSTMSQLGYMFLALGVGAWSAAIFHLMTHAFFKALLFLGAGSVILCLHHEQDIFKMGGLRQRLPLAFICFLVGGLALIALPLTSGYYSKHEVLLATLDHPVQGISLWWVAVVGALMTGLYTSRLMFVVFFGDNNSETHGDHAHEIRESVGWSIRLPLIVLIGLSVVGGWISMPLAGVFELPEAEGHGASMFHEAVMLAAPLIGIALAYLAFQRKQPWASRLKEYQVGQGLSRFWFSGWGFDALYQTVFINPFLWFTRVNKQDVIDRFYSGVAWCARTGHMIVLEFQSGHVRWYAAAMGLGAVAIIGGVLYVVDWSTLSATVGAGEVSP